MLLATSCTMEQHFEIPQEVTSSWFDTSAETIHNLYEVSYEIVDIHIDFDYFQQVLPTGLLTRLQGARQNGINPSLDDMVEAIWKWYECDDTMDVMCEWPGYDDFIIYLSDTPYWDKYHFEC